MTISSQYSGDAPEAAQDCCQEPSLGEPEVWPTVSALSFRDKLDHWAVRWGYRRGEHRVKPGLYALGQPTEDSPVLVTANYSLSFDALRSSLPGRDGHLLVLDTQGINVWCAAGKGTFGTDELVHRLQVTNLSGIVSHRKLILPQLGAPGVAAHEVWRRSGFRVEYGPVRAADLPAYLDAGKATPEMRQVTFTLAERAVLVPVEVVHHFIPMLIGALALLVLAGWLGALGAVAAVLAGVVLFPLLLPWIPTREFSSKGFILGALVALPFALMSLNSGLSVPWVRAGRALGLMLGLPPVTAYIALNFTGATPLTSPSGVKREMFRYLRVGAVMLVIGALCVIVTGVAGWLGG